MDAQTAQLRHRVDTTRAALDAKLTQLERRVSQLPAVLHALTALPLGRCDGSA